MCGPLSMLFLICIYVLLYIVQILQKKILQHIF